MAEDFSANDNRSSDGKVNLLLAGYVQQLFEHIVISEGKEPIHQNQQYPQRELHCLIATFTSNIV